MIFHCRHRATGAFNRLYKEAPSCAIFIENRVFHFTRLRFANTGYSGFQHEDRGRNFDRNTGVYVARTINDAMRYHNMLRFSASWAACYGNWRFPYGGHHSHRPQFGSALASEFVSSRPRLREMSNEYNVPRADLLPAIPQLF